LRTAVAMQSFPYIRGRLEADAGAVQRVASASPARPPPELESALAGLG
jgi:hypothetical protein